MWRDNLLDFLFMTAFHLAIPTHDLEASKDFYTKAFGASIGREYSHYVIFNFFGHQLVTHMDEEECPTEVRMYPRHFGIILETFDELKKVYDLCKNAGVSFYEDLFERFKEKAGWHHSFFVIDPSNNLIEFKYYVNEKDIFS